MNKPLNISTQISHLIICLLTTCLLISAPAVATTSVNTASDPSVSDPTVPLSADLANSTKDITKPLSNPDSAVHIETANQLADPLGYQPPQQNPQSDTKLAHTEKHWSDERREDVQDQLHLWANNMNAWFGEPDSKKPATASLRVILDSR